MQPNQLVAAEGRILKGGKNTKGEEVPGGINFQQSTGWRYLISFVVKIQYPNRSMSPLNLEYD